MEVNKEETKEGSMFEHPAVGAFQTDDDESEPNSVALEEAMRILRNSKNEL